MTPDSRKERAILFAQTVVALQGTNPQAWDRFMALLAARLDDVTEACISSPPASLTNMQGRAQEARDLFKELASARKLVDDLHAKGNQ